MSRETFKLSAQQRRTYLRSAGTRWSRCRLHFSRPVDGEDVAETAVRLPALADAIHTRFLHRPGERFPVVQVVEGAVPATEPAVPSAAPDHWRVRLHTDPTGRSVDLACPALLCDGSSLALMGTSLAAALFGRSPPEVRPPGYLQFAAWQDYVLESCTDEERAFWQAKRADLALCPPAIAGDPGAGDGGWASHTVVEDAPLLGSLEAVARSLNCTVAELILECWATLVARNAHRDEVCVGVTLPGRHFDQFRDVCGPIARTVPVRVRVGAALEDSIGELRAAIGEAEELEECFDWGLSPGDEATFATGFRYLEPTATTGDGWRLGRLVDADDAARLFCSVLGGDSLRVQLDFDPRVHSEASVRPLGRQLRCLLDLVAGGHAGPLPDPIVHDEDRRNVRRVFNPPPRPRDAGASPAGLFRRQAEERADAVALVAGDDVLTYGALEARAERLAQAMRAAGGGPVALLLRPGAPLIEAMVASMLASTTMVPLEPGTPAAIVDHVLRSSGSTLVITERSLQAEAASTGLPLLLADDLPSAGDAPGPSPALDPSAPVYIVYTSGTTGRPKGVAVGARALANYALWLHEGLDVGPADTHALVTSAAFDLGYSAIFGALLHGGTLVVPGEAVLGDPAELVSTLVATGVTVLKLTPSLLALLLQSEDELARARLRMVVVGGEAIRPADVERLHELLPAVEIVNHYGPTETTIGCIAERVGPADVGRFCARPVLGRPIANTRVYVLDEALRLLAPGVVGELCIAGDGLSDGYVGDPEQTRRRFVPAEGGELVYRSGDLGFWYPDGRIAFVGRRDSQMKVRGHRVELEGVARVLRDHPAIEDAAVVALPREGGQPQLAAYCVLSERAAGPVRRLCELLVREPEMGAQWIELPDGHPVVSRSRAETAFMFDEIFSAGTYLHGGVSLEAGDVVLDVGANIGLFGLQATLAGARVVAVEPDPATYRLLEANAALYGDTWTCVHAGVAALPGAARLTTYRDHSLLSTLYPAAAEDRRRLHALAGALAETQLDALLDEQLQSRTVDCVLLTVSNLIRDLQLARVDLLKIDVQRAEWDVLQGIEPEHWPLIGQIVAEVHDSDDRVARVQALLASKSFAVRVDRDANDRAILYAVRASRRPRMPVPAGRRGWSRPRELVSELRAHAASNLPAYALPARVVLLPEIPRTANGKRDLAALAEVPAHGLEIERRPTEPTTPRGVALAEAWREVLQVAEVGLESDFLQLGGDSLRAAALTTRIRDTMQIHCTMAQVLRHSRFEDFLAQLEAGTAKPAPVVDAAPRRPRFALSHLQQRVWMLAQLEGGNEAFNMTRALRLRGEVDAALLERALVALAGRHDALRSAFLRAELLQETQPLDACHPELSIEVGPEQWDAEVVAARSRAEARRPFDLAGDCLLRAVLVDFGTVDHLLLLTTHHIVSDGWSAEVMIRDLLKAYARLRAGQDAFPEPPGRRHRDFVHAINAAAEQAERDAGAYLKRWGEPPPRPLALPVRARRGRTTGFVAATQCCVSEAATLDGIRALARDAGVSPFTVAVTALQVLLAEWTRGTDITLVATVSGRDLPGSEDQIGFFADAIALRQQIGGGEPFADLLGRNAPMIVEALEHKDVPLDRFTDLVGGRGPGIANVGFTWFEIGRPAPAATGCGFSCEPLDVDDLGARADLWFFAEPGRDLQWKLIYDAELFSEQCIEALGGALVTLLDRLVRDPSAPVGGRVPAAAVGVSQALDFELDFGATER